MKKPLVSIIIPCYNHGKYLPFCIKTIQNQGIKEVEIIIINDASTDDSLEVAKGLAKKDKRIKILNNPLNVGCVASVNRGGKFSRGKYILNFSATDGLLPGHLREQIKILEENPEIGFVFSETRFIDEHGNKLYDSKIRKKESYLGKWEYLEYISYGEFIQSPILIRKNALKKVGFQNENIPIAAEWYLKLNLVKNFKSAYINKPLTLFRIEKKSLSNNYDPSLLKKEFDWAIKEHIKENPSKTIKRYLYASTNYHLGKDYYHKKKYINSFMFFIKSLKNPFCVLAHIKAKFKE